MTNGYTVMVFPSYTSSDAGSEYELWDASCPGPNYPVLKRGSTGDCVRLAQSRLARHGFLPVSGVDGIFGPKTEAAVKAFQAAKGLMVDGIIGPRTWDALIQPPATQPPAQPPEQPGGPEQPEQPGQPQPDKLAWIKKNWFFIIGGLAAAGIIIYAVRQYQLLE